MAFVITKTKRSVSHKKIASKHIANIMPQYIKHYWPYLPMLLLIASVLVFFFFFSQPVLWDINRSCALAIIANSPPRAPTNPVKATTFKPRLILNFINAAAASPGWCRSQNYRSHNTQTAKPRPITSYILYQKAGENLAYGFDALSTINAWMLSLEHRANILNEAYSQVGGVASLPNFDLSPKAWPATSVNYAPVRTSDEFSSYG